MNACFLLEVAAAFITCESIFDGTLSSKHSDLWMDLEGFTVNSSLCI